MTTSANELAALAPCPFCGGKAWFSGYVVQCCVCGCQLIKEERGAAIPAWNTRATSTAGVREAYSALFEPEESDAFDNLEGALIDIERLSANGKPTDKVCIRTIKRVLDQLNTAYSRMQGVLASSPTNSEWNAAVEACAKIAEKDRRSKIAIKYDHIPDFQRHALSLAKEIRSLHRGVAPGPSDTAPQTDGGEDQ